MRGSKLLWILSLSILITTSGCAPNAAYLLATWNEIHHNKYKEIRDCIRHGFPKDSNPHARARLALAIRRDGGVSRVGWVESETTLREPAVRTCIERQASNWRFTPHADVGDPVLWYDFCVAPQNEPHCHERMGQP